MYKVWVDGHTIRTNQVRFRETEFLGLEINDRSDSFSELYDEASINLTVSDRSIDRENDCDDTPDDANDVLVSDEKHNVENDQPADLESSTQSKREAVT